MEVVEGVGAVEEIVAARSQNKLTMCLKKGEASIPRPVEEVNQRTLQQKIPSAKTKLIRPKIRQQRQ